MICVWQCAVNTFLLWGIVHEHCSPRDEYNVLNYFSPMRAMFWECTLVQLVWVGGWPFWWQLGLWVRGWESSMSTLWTDHFTPRIFVLLAFPSTSILAVSPPSMLGGSILHTSSSNICIHSLYFTAPIHECFDYWRVLLIYNSVTWVCVWGGMGLQCLEGIILSGLDMRLISQKEVQRKY